MTDAVVARPSPSRFDFVPRARSDRPKEPRARSDRPKELYRAVVRGSSIEFVQTNLGRAIRITISRMLDVGPEHGSSMTCSRIVHLKAPEKTAIIDEVIQRAAVLDRAGSTDAALDAIYDLFNYELHRDNVQAVDEAIANLRAAELSSDILIGILTATLPAKHRLASRQLLVKQTSKLLKSRREWEEGILSGLY